MLAQVDKGYLKTRPSAALRRIISRAFFEGRPITTKGRWFNKVVFAHFAIEKRLPQLKKVKQPVFIVGTGRSGTTVLGTLFSMHPDVGFLSEPKALWHSIYAGEDVSGNYTMSHAKYCLDESDATAEVVQAAHRLFGAYLATTFSNYVVDKNPELVFRIPFVKAIFPDAKFVFLVRNGFDTIKSIANWSDREGVRIRGETHDWWGVDNKKWLLMLDELVQTDHDLSAHFDVIQNFDNHFDMATVEWIVTMRHGIKQFEKYKDSVLMLHYETLLANPTSTLQDLFAFCGLPDDDLGYRYAENRLTAATKYDYPSMHPLLLEPFAQMQTTLGYKMP